MTEERDCRMRADAKRNRLRIIDAARREIAVHGLDVPMEQIGRAAGVAVGTLYRHYPTKTDLVRAILTEISESAIVSAEEAAEAPLAAGDALRRITTLLTDLFEEAASNHAVKAAAQTFGAADMSGEQEERARRAMDILLAAAKADGDIRIDMTSDDLFLFIRTAPASAPKAARARWLEIMLSGISAR